MPLILTFFIYAFFGWIIEVIYYMYKEKRFVNRGFLNGPLIPIYGLSMVFLHLIIYSTYPHFNPEYPFNIVSVFLIIVVLSTTLEFIGGVILYHLFETRWWDYSHLKFNYKGFVCLRYSLIWGVMGTIGFSYLHHYQIYPYIETMNERLIAIINTSLIIVFFIDWMFTIISLINFKKMLVDLKRKVLLISHDSTNLKEKLGRTRFNVLRSNVNTIVDNFKNDERYTKVKSRIEQLKDFFVSPKAKEERREFESLRKLADKISSSRLYKAFPEIKLALKEDEESDKKEEKDSKK